MIIASVSHKQDLSKNFSCVVGLLSEKTFAEHSWNASNF